jgi:hypothetical protein
MPVKTTGSRLALAAYNAADRPAGPEPRISILTLFTCVDFFVEKLFGLKSILIPLPIRDFIDIHTTLGFTIYKIRCKSRRKVAFYIIN